jgi:sulfoxide reductase heme-binding subunit YedZ
MITFITDATGYIALVFMAITLMIGTVNLILKHGNPVSSYFRRDLGIYSGILAVIHSLTGLFVHLRGSNWKYFLNKTANGYTIRLDDFGLANYTGLIATLLILLLLVTSNDYSIRKLNPSKWKIIQRFSYLMFALVLIHSVYYRIVGNNLNRVYYLYLPLLSIVLISQLIGIRLKHPKTNKII